ncbi:hypothetical protein NL676_037224 [Syzygium grande]|nr:hypothetical protein NL676_037224 [Syzygium grande]
MKLSEDGFCVGTRRAQILLKRRSQKMSDACATKRSSKKNPKPRLPPKRGQVKVWDLQVRYEESGRNSIDGRAQKEEKMRRKQAGLSDAP